MPAVASLFSVLFHACVLRAGTTGSARSQVLANLVHWNTGSAVDLSEPAGRIAARAMLALDSDSDGKVSSDELTAYGKSNGIDSATSASEFTALDLNSDGSLDASEIAGVLGEEKTAQPLQAVAVSAADVASSVVPGPVALGRAKATSQEPAAKGRNHHKKNTFLSTASKTSHDMAQLMKSRASAQNVVAQLDAEARSTAQAVQLEQHADDLRARAKAMAELTSHQALEAAQKAAAAKATELIEQLEALDSEAKSDEVQAAMLHARLHADMEHSGSLLAVGSAPLEELPQLPKTPHA